MRLVRPRQWTKNLVVAAGLVFSGSFTELHALLLVAAAVVVFCALSSGGYVINDILDEESDRAASADNYLDIGATLRVRSGFSRIKPPPTTTSTQPSTTTTSTHRSTTTTTTRPRTTTTSLPAPGTTSSSQPAK